jgi:curved DNA-binding protein CbpA
MSTANPYAVLGVPEDASAAEIKQAYRRQMRLAAVDTHPDVSEAERELLQARMIEVNWAFESLSGPRRRSVDEELRRRRAAEARREEELRWEQTARQAAWEAAQRRARQARDRERVAQAMREAAAERDRLQRARRQAQEHARRTRQRQGEDARRYREAAWVREHAGEGPGYRYEVRVEGPASTQEFLDALWDLLGPRAGQDVYETIELTREEWAAGVVWASGVDGLPLPGLEHSPPATYRFTGRGAQGVYGGPRGDHYVTVVHVDDAGRPVVGGFHDAAAERPMARSDSLPPVRP